MGLETMVINENESERRLASVDDTDVMSSIDDIQLTPLESGSFTSPIEAGDIADFYGRGIESIRRHEWDDAIDHFTDGLALDPLREHSRSAVDLSNIEYCHDKLKKYD